MLYINYPTWLTSEVIPGFPALRWYGVMYLVAFVITYLLFMVQAREKKLDTEKDKDTILNFFFWGILGLVVGGRVSATLLFSGTDLYLRKPWLIFWPFSGGQFIGLQGMNYYGGLAGVVLALVIYARVRKIDIREWGDMLVAGAPLGYTFGRLGNFINGELYGRVTASPWGFLFPHADPVPLSDPFVRETAQAVGLTPAQGVSVVNLPRHPTQLYETLLEGVVLWLILWFVFRKRKPFKGFLIGMYVLGYGVARFVVDYVRMPLIDPEVFTLRLSPLPNPTYRFMTPFNITDSQVYSFLMIVAGVAVILIFGSVARGERLRADTATQRSDTRKLRRKLAK